MCPLSNAKNYFNHILERCCLKNYFFWNNLYISEFKIRIFHIISKFWICGALMNRELNVWNFWNDLFRHLLNKLVCQIIRLKVKRALQERTILRVCSLFGVVVSEHLWPVMLNYTIRYFQIQMTKRPRTRLVRFE